MKRLFSLLLAFCLLLTVQPTTLPLQAADNDGSFAEYRTKSGDTWGSWTTVTNSSSLKSVLNSVSNLTIEIYMNRDWNLKEDWTRTQLWSTYGDRITIGSNSDVTIHMRGHMITRGLSSNEDYANVFCLEAGAKLTLIGSESETEAAIEHTVKDYASNSDGSVTKTVTGGTLTGCYSNPMLQGHGGALYFDGEGASVVLQNVTIAGNYFKNNGSGVRFNAESCSLTMDNSKILYNYSGGYGGGICVENKDSCSVVMKNGSAIDENRAVYGGGVYVDNDSCEIKGDGTCSISGNTVTSDGGGVYFNKNNGNVSGCKIDGNTASGNGGGVYCNDAAIGDRGSALGACTVTNNRATNGGGIYVDSSYVLTLSGLTTIEDNENSSGGDSNLYLSSGAKLNLENDTRSVIHFSVQSPSNDLQLSTAAGTYADFNFIYDGSGYHAKWYDDIDHSNAKYRFLYLVSGDATPIPAPTEVALEAKTSESDYVVDGTAYERFRTYFTFSVITDAENDLDALCFYSDGYFFEDPKVYNEHLSTMSAALMAAGYYTNRGRIGTYGYENATVTGYENKHASLRQLLANIGCEDETIYVNQFNLEQPGTDSIGVGMAHKTLRTKDGTDTGYILVPISIRGSGYEGEWASNVTVGPEGEELGFATAANTVYSELLHYVDAYGLTEAAQQGKLVFWVVGYSRSGATANLTAKRLIEHCSPAVNFTPSTNTTLDAAALAGVDDDGFGNNKVFCYTFEAAQGGTDAAEGSADKTAYYCIHNVVNKADAVPYVGPAEMGFKRYGVDHYLPGSAAGQIQRTQVSITRGAAGDTTVTTYRDNDYYAVGSTEYQARRGAAVEHMAAVNPYMVFDDYFTTATINWVSGNLPGWIPSWLGKKDLNTPVSSNLTAEDYLSALMPKLQEWGITSRTWFSTEPVTINGTEYTTFQQALRDLFEIVYSRPDGPGGILNGFSVSDVSIPYGKIYDLYTKVIRDWYNQPDATKEELLAWVWDNIVVTSGILDDFDETQQGRIHNAWPTIADPLLTILSRDYNDETLTGTGQSYLGTLLYNVGRILNNHFAETLFGWLRADDSYYTTKPNNLYYQARETTRYAISRPATVAAPSGAAQGVEDVALDANSRILCCGNQVVHLGVDNVSGEAVYYKVSSRQSNRSLPGGWELYTDGIELPAPAANETPIVYTIETYAISHGQRSETVSYEVEVGNFIRLAGYSLTLDGSILLNVYLDVPAAYSSSTVTMSSYDGKYDVTSTQSTAVDDADCENGLFRFSFGVPAKNMNDAIEISVRDQNGDPVNFYVCGGLASRYSLSVQSYLQAVIGDSGTYGGALVDLCKAMCDYGYAAQVHFDYETNVFPDAGQNSEYTWYQPTAIADLSADDLSAYAHSVNAGSSVRFRGGSLVTLSETAVRLYFRYRSDQSYTVSSQSISHPALTVYDDTTGYVEISNIAAKDLGNAFDVTLTNPSDPTDTITVSHYSAYSYVRTVLRNQNASPDLVQLVKTIKLYGDAAASYFTSQNP